MKKIFYIPIVLSCLILAGCNTEDELKTDIISGYPDNVLPISDSEQGTADLSNYVAIGNSLTAGFADAALYPEGQAMSFPSLLAGQFNLAGGGSFTFPDISSGNGFGGLNADNSIRGKSFINVPAALVDPSNAIQFLSGSALGASSNTGSDLNNFGVPGARIIDAVTPGYGAFNPFYGAFQSDAAASMLGDAISANPSFFTLWLGSNDVLGYATSGGVETDGDNVEGNQADPTNPDLLTDIASFQGALTATLDGLSANGAEGIMLNIPPVTLVPFFQIVTQLSGGVNLIPLDAATAGAVNAAYNDPSSYNPGLGAAVLLGIITQAEADRRTINFVEGANPPVITDESLTTADISAALGLPAGSVILPNLRQAEATDLFPLTALSVIGTESVPGNPSSVYGVGVGVPDEFTLTLAEQTAIITRYATFNGIMALEAANRPNIELLDVGPLFADIFGLTGTQAALLGLSTEAQAAADGVLGLTVNGFNMVPLDLGNSLFNSIWSSDGVHPNARGAGIVANEIIKVINAKYGATIEPIDILALPGIQAQL